LKENSFSENCLKIIKANNIIEKLANLEKNSIDMNNKILELENKLPNEDCEITKLN